MVDWERLVLQVHQVLLELWWRVRKSLDLLDLMVWMEHLVFLDYLEQREKWELEETWVPEVLLEKMDFRVLQVCKVKREELEMLVNLDYKDRKETRALMEKWDHLEFKVPQDYLDSLDNREYLDFLEIKDLQAEKETQVHQELMERMV